MDSGIWRFLSSGDILALAMLFGEMWSRAEVATCTVKWIGRLGRVWGDMIRVVMQRYLY